MADLSAPIRKLEKRARHHRAVAEADRMYADACGDRLEEQDLLQSAEVHDLAAESYEAALKILREADPS